MRIHRSPFYEWLEHDVIRDLVHRAQALTPGERLVLMKGLVPGLVSEMGLDSAVSFLDELAAKARRFEEAQSHPGEGRRLRHVPGETLGGPTPSGHRHLAEPRNPDRPGGRDAEREWEHRLWDDTVGRSREGTE